MDIIALHSVDIVVYTSTMKAYPISKMKNHSMKRYERDIFDVIKDDGFWEKISDDDKDSLNNLMFGEHFMKSKDKGSLRDYKSKNGGIDGCK